MDRDVPGQSTNEQERARDGDPGAEAGEPVEQGRESGAHGGSTSRSGREPVRIGAQARASPRRNGAAPGKGEVKPPDGRHDVQRLPWRALAWISERPLHPMPRVNRTASWPRPLHDAVRGPHRVFSPRGGAPFPSRSEGRDDRDERQGHSHRGFE